VRRDIMTCPDGHALRIVDALAGQPPRHEMYAKVVLGADGRKRYEPVGEFDRALYRECSELLARTRPRLVLPQGELADGENTRQAIRWGYTTWRRFFNDRQLYSLGLLAAAIRGLDAAEPEREAIAALFSGALEFNNMFCSFKGEGTGAVRHMFSHHILKPERTPLEAHPWGTPASSGSFSTLYRTRLLRAHASKTAPADQVVAGQDVRRVTGISLPTQAAVTAAFPARGLAPGLVCLRTGDSSRTDLPDQSVDLVVTDPPYMDNVHYSELADFFHAWLRGLMPFPGYPAGAATTRSNDEVQSASPEAFRKTITSVWRECARVLRADGLMAFTFHQARLSGWVALMLALAEAGFVVSAVQPVKGEMSTSVAKNGLEPSNLDAIIVCRKRGAAPAQASVADAHEAAELGARRLAGLRSAGIEVGPGDVRSVIRGHVLGTYTASPEQSDIDALAALADSLAARHIATLQSDRPQDTTSS
jgi:hypothetical protein